MNPALYIILHPVLPENAAKDTSLAMAEYALGLSWPVFLVDPQDLWLDCGTTHGQARRLLELDHHTPITESAQEHAFGPGDILLMRQDPPFNMAYIYNTYLLELAQRQGAVVCNDPRSIRDANEKLFTAWFKDLCPPTLVTQNQDRIRAFIAKMGEVILKPLDLMGGEGIFKVSSQDPERDAIVERCTASGTTLIMAQRFLPEIEHGDKRILLIHGKPVEHVLLRTPQPGHFLGNMAAGGSTSIIPLSAHDRRICAQIGPTLTKKGLDFVGIDVIGDALTEINVTSPTGIRQLEAQHPGCTLPVFFDFLQSLTHKIKDRI